MNDTTRLEVQPELAGFVDKVRARLSDLTDEEREELLGGLEADLTELVADGGSVAELGDPRAYADELRSAAGLERRRVRGVTAAVRRPRRPVREIVADDLDRFRARWEELMSSRPETTSAWDVAQTVRPAWWVLRAWIAVEMLDLYTGPWETATLIPRFGDDLSGLVLLVAAVVGSVLMGMRKIWPASGSPRSVFARTSLLGLNVVAVLWLFVVVDAFPTASYLHEQSHPCAVGACGSYVPRDGLVNDGKRVRNVFAYDAQGSPIEGVQLFDQTGKPLAVDPGSVSRMRYAGRLPYLYSWQNGNQKVWNVYPLAVRFGNNGWGRKADAWTSDTPPVLPQPPLAAVPPVSLPLPAAVDEPAAEPTAGPTAASTDGGTSGPAQDSKTTRRNR